jgi:hypothetical protein
MITFIEMKVRLGRIQSDGTSKQVSERYLVQADSFAEAESILINSVDVDSIESISKSRVQEVFLSERGAFLYEARVEYNKQDEKPQNGKKSGIVVIVNASNIASAIARVMGCITDGEILSVTKTNIVDIFGL